MTLLLASVPYKIKLRGGKYRLTDRKTGRIAMRRDSQPVDGGGHDSRDKAYRQASAIMHSESQRKGKKNR